MPPKIPQGMRLVIPLPFGEIELSVRPIRRPRPLFWFTLASALFHVVVLSVLGAYLLHAIFPVEEKPQLITVALSSAVRIEHRTIPQPVKQPVPAPEQPKTIAQQPQQQTPVRPEPVRTPSQRRELSRPQRPDLAAQLAADNHAFERTVAHLNAQNNPLAGDAEPTEAPAAPKRYTLNLSGKFGHPEPEGILYPLKRWTDGANVYYYVRYSAEYADGSTEEGVVPWPIHFPLRADPFARGIHEMPLPGPPEGYLAPEGISMEPLVRNCYDHRYAYCPIQHESDS